jgi:protocatechuate 3,4-dioxygenase, alpha subunit
MRPGRTPSQTVGPFFGFALPWPAGPRAVAAGTPGEIRLRGRLLDGAGAPIPDGLVETWQADGAGRFAGAAADGFRGFARAATDGDGRYQIFTVKPGPVRGADGAWHAPHVAVSIVARGLLKRAVTRLYFSDEEAANAADPVLAAVADAAARATLIAAREDGGYRLDLRLSGAGETVFFDV